MRPARNIGYIAEALRNSPSLRRRPVHQALPSWIEERTGCAKALLTHSCTSALDMAALLLDLKSPATK